MATLLTLILLCAVSVIQPVQGQDHSLSGKWEIAITDSASIPADGWQSWELLSMLPTQQTLWLKSTIANNTQKETSSILYLGGCQDVEVILQNKSGQLSRRYTTGTTIPISELQVPNGYIINGVGNSAQTWIDIPPGEQTLYIRYEAPIYEHVALEIELFSEAEWHQSLVSQNSKTFLIQGLIIGALLIISIYHFLIYLIRRDGPFLWYALYTMAVALMLSVESGVFQSLFLKDAQYAMRLVWETQVLSMVCGILYFVFMRSFLDLKNLMPWLDKLVIGFLLIYAPFAMSVDLYYVMTLYFAPWQFIFPLSILSIGLFCVTQLIRSGDRLAMYFSIGSLLLFTGAFSNTLVSIFVDLHWITEPTWPRIWLTEGGIIFEILIFSLGLGYRLRLKDNEQELAMTTLRTNISSDLHDDVGTMLSGLSMQADVMKFKATGTERDQLEEISQISRDAMDRMRDTVWAIDSRQDQYVNLVDRIREHTEKTLDQSDLDYEITSSGFLMNEVILPNHRQQLYLIFKEALTNTIKHAQATRVKINLHKSKSDITFTISDDGIGNYKSESTGQGLENIKMRAKRLGGSLKLENEGGLKITVVVPLLQKTIKTTRG